MSAPVLTACKLQALLCLARGQLRRSRAGWLPTGKNLHGFTSTTVYALEHDGLVLVERRPGKRDLAKITYQGRKAARELEARP